MTSALVTRLVSIASVLYGITGLLLLFFSNEMGNRLGMPEGAEIAVSMWGAGLLGFSIMSWTARTSILGGIYGRAVVIGSQMHSTVGFLMLLKTFRAEDGIELWPMTGLLLVYGLTAALFTYLMLNHPKKEAVTEELTT